MFFARILLTLFFLSRSHALLANDLCVESGLAGISPLINSCQTLNVRYIDEGLERTVRLASAYKETRRDIDVFRDIYHFALELPNGQIHYLGEFKPWTTVLFWPIWSSGLGMTRVFSATASQTGDELYERQIYREGNQFCVRYRMKSPFWGEVNDCDGNHSTAISSIGVLPDVIPPKDAWLEACRLFLHGKIEFCGDFVNHVSTIVRRTKTGDLNYVVELGNFFEESPPDRGTVSAPAAPQLKIFSSTCSAPSGTSHIQGLTSPLESIDCSECIGSACNPNRYRKAQPSYVVYVIAPQKNEVKFISIAKSHKSLRELVETDY